ncbi:FecR family protein [Rhizobium sp. NFR07]|uniref:FecR family protein n=1 Tax=Rhizobium sp. NFR07 TaxID=1566262 RepID=UPI0008E73246|nr:FecR domain-containing protein [Rhizobium sp. NFR07]SFB15917.1 FecR family protein [Rhizobium sp. NFR07]
MMDEPADMGSDGDGGDRAAREAAMWFARLLDDDTPQTDYALFRNWLEADARNAQAYARLERLWAIAGSEIVPSHKSHTEKSVSRRGLLKATSAAILLTGGGLTAWTVLDRADYSTGTGELETVMLEDGSRVELSAASAISVDITASVRRIILHHGEAFFSVTEDSARPFIVQAGNVRATALGTAYSVGITSERTSVAVTEHTVRVDAGGRHIDLGEGDAIDVENGRLGAIGTGEAGNRLAWRSRQLVFLARPLSEVIAEVNRWRRGNLILRDPQLAQRRITIVIDLKDIEGIDLTLEQGLPITLTSYTPIITLVSARK